MRSGGREPGKTTNPKNYQKSCLRGQSESSDIVLIVTSPYWSSSRIKLAQNLAYQRIPAGSAARSLCGRTPEWWYGTYGTYHTYDTYLTYGRHL